MQQIELMKDFSLQGLNTLQCPAVAEQFVEIHHITDLQNLCIREDFSADRLRVLGSGSNILMPDHVSGCVIHVGIKGVQLLREDQDYVWLKVGAGENWHDWVTYSVEQGWGGIENLALIPGTVGAAPIQNIGAYGVEVKNSVFEVEALSLQDGYCHVFAAKDCDFTYRESFFKKNPLYVVTSVTFQLRKKPQLHLSYPRLQKHIEQLSSDCVNIKTVFDTVVAIRQARLPDPNILANAGSFFKNPEWPKELCQKLVCQLGFQCYPSKQQGRQKLSAAQLIDYLGWKGHRQDGVGVSDKHALILVNYEGVSAKHIEKLVQNIQQSIYNEWGLYLEQEVRQW